MSLDLSAPSVPLSPPAPAAAATVAGGDEAAKRAQIAKTAKAFESSFLSVMLGQMFKDVNTSGPFGGGAGEEAFKSFMTDAMAKQMVKSGGIGLAQSVQKEMLKMQGLAPLPAQPAAAAYAQAAALAPRPVAQPAIQAPETVR